MNSPTGLDQQNDGHVRVHIPPSPSELYNYSGSESFSDILELDKQQGSSNSSSKGGGGGGSRGDSNRKVSVVTRLKKQLIAELYITGEHVVRALSPAAPGHHLPIFTITLLVLLILIFGIMMGQYDAFIMSSSSSQLECLVPSWNNQGIGPEILLRWITPKRYPNWCTAERGSFNASFLIRWGARWGPFMKNQPQRWFTSAIIHINFMHIFSNCMLLVALGGLMEIEHGWLRIAPGWFLSALGGNLMSSVVEGSCIAVVGASGGIYGLIGMFIMEMFINWKALKRKMTRIVILVSFSIIFGISIATDRAGTSHLSHVGGVFFGVLWALAAMPKGFSQPWRIIATILGIMSLGDILQVTAGLVVRVYSFYRFDDLIKTVSRELLGHHGKIVQFTIINVTRLLLAPKLVSRAPPNAALQQAMAATGRQQQQQDRQQQAVPAVRGIPPLPARR
ncbi:putative Rhomboid-like protease 4 [Nannochloris sp. 'desiccata']|nr:putative Rhomboid-like protease 4 [Chlorella desiccata (nom. nud.)]